MSDEDRIIIEEAAGLDATRTGVDPEYRRAIIELSNRLLGRTSDEIERTEAEIVAATKEEG